MIEDLVVEYDMCVANTGKTPTCTSGNPGSVIDITLLNSESNILSDGKVSKEDCFSDQKLITFDIKSEMHQKQKRRKMNESQKNQRHKRDSSRSDR